MKYVRCDECHGNGWKILFVGITTTGVIESARVQKCYWCKGVGTVEVEDPENLVKPEEEVKK